ncbi:Programmed cell death protein 2, C-terminal putative domain family protein [Candida albicans]|uniref:Programmed cell death protein 2, C-terminal putative domain family protein n=1 Tax=Candida albicans TaxID=5476 RepID=A0A8H6C323_CANAX|nr:Programmed cell death protein 2, C-terminal putative domain family protein [Candida albicans]KAF6070509.1 Programmed cell death protein 2, C-terminal putative domain family protein [Candida albicans]
MSANDEYSSDEESFDESTKSKVLLGFVDAPIISDGKDPEDNDLPTIEDTFIGGQPVWLHPDSKPAEKSLTCDVCNGKLALYLQAFAPIDGKLYDRVIYVFGCKNTKSCSGKKGTVKVIRGIIKDSETVNRIKKENQEALQKDMEAKLKLEKQKKFNDELTKDLFKKKDTPEASNPFGGNSNPFSNPFDVASKNAPKPKSVKKLQDDLPEYHKEEYDESDILEKPSSSASASGLDNPQASQISNMLNDKYFEMFSNTVKHNPGQVLRYDLGGKPLLYSGKDDVAKKFLAQPANIPRPSFNPSSERRFELQLMPKAIMDLEDLGNNRNVGINDILNGMSWGTIIVCTDEEDFIPEENFDANQVGYIEEWCGVQWEESV